MAATELEPAPSGALLAVLSDAVRDLGAPDDFQPRLDRPGDPAHGDLTTNVAMVLAGALYLTFIFKITPTTTDNIVSFFYRSIGHRFNWMPIAIITAVIEIFFLIKNNVLSHIVRNHLMQLNTSYLTQKFKVFMMPSHSH